VTFRARLVAALLPTVLLPLAVVGWGVRRAVSARVTELAHARAETGAEAVRQGLAGAGADLARRLAAVRRSAAGDPRLRAALIQDSDRDYVRDFAGSAMRVAGLATLQVLDSDGTVLSSGHFRNAYGQAEPGLAALLRAAPDTVALVRARSADRSFLALARLDSFRLGARRFGLVGGIGVDSAWLARLAAGADVTVAVDSGTPVSGVTLRIPVPLLSAEDAGAAETAAVTVNQSLAPLRAVQAGIDRWLAAGLGGAALLGVLLAGWLAARLSRPLSDLAARASALDLERLDTPFDSGGRDEVGRLSAVLGAMTARLRDDAERARRAERRAALGDLARQVNHDIRNGLTPIRNVFRHWTDVADARPAELPTVFAERRGTVESSIAYLQALAAEYARLGAARPPQPCDLNAAIAGAAARFAGDDGVTVRLELADPAPLVRADPLALRRMIDNLAVNARESLAGGGGTVTLRTEGGARVRLQVLDTGVGMSEAELERALGGFHSTKPDGSGLGLAIVRRLAGDAGGALRVDTAPGRGSSFTVEFPRLEDAGAGDGGGER